LAINQRLLQKKVGTVEVKAAEDAHVVKEAIVMDKTTVAVGIDGLRAGSKTVVAEARAKAIITQLLKIYADGCLQGQR
jgi:hypothetical protein